MKLYLAGPMRGYPDFNFPAFERASGDLRSQNYLVWSPHESDLEAEWAARQGSDYDPATGSAGDQAATLRFFMVVDLPAVLGADAIAVLDGWQASVGCQVETYCAFQSGIPVRRYVEGTLFTDSPDLSRYEHPHIIKGT